MGRIPDEIIAQILERTDIVQTISAYIPLKKAGRNYKALCPFHTEKSPSFVVNPDKQIYHCFGCAEGGNAINFVMKQERLEFPEAVRKMADRVGIVIPETGNVNPKIKDLKQSICQINELATQFYHQALMSERDPAVNAAREYLKGRGISSEIVQKFRVGFALDSWDGLLTFLRSKDINLSLLEKAGLIIAREKKDGYYDRFRNRIVFPIFDIKAQCVAFGARTMRKEDTAKYINSPETEVYVKGQHLYGFHLSKQAVTQEDHAIVVEGYMDFIMPFQAGVQNIVASLGTALTAEQIRLLRRYTQNVVMLYDTDKAGEAAIIRSLDLLIEEGMNVKVATLAEGDDPDSFIRKYGADALKERLKNSQSLFEYKLKWLREKHDGRTVEGRAKICGEMLPTINKFENAIIRAEYLRQLSQALSVSQEALFIESQKFVSMMNNQLREIQPKKVVQPIAQPPRRVEWSILKLILEDEQFVSRTKEEVELSDFQDESIRNIITEIYRLFEEGKEINPVSLINSFSDERVLKIISSLSVEEAVEQDRDKMHQDCVARIIQDRVKSKRQYLVEQIRLAEKMGDHTALELLKEQFDHLVKNKI